MSLDGFMVHGIVEELQQLVGGRINKIYQPFNQELHLQIRAQGKNQRLVGSIHPNYYRLHISQERPDNPTEPAMFCMMLRKHIENAVILKIDQVENDRIVRIELNGRNELGDLISYYLYYELMGRHSNIILVASDTGKIIDCIKHVPADINSYRTLQPGYEYIEPPKQTGQVNILELDDLSSFINDNKDLITSGQAGRVIQGMGRQSADFLEYIINQEGYSVDEAIYRYLNEVTDPYPTLIRGENKSYYYSFDMDHLKGEREHFETLSELIDSYYHEAVRHDRIKQASGNLTHHLQQIIDRNTQKINNLKKDKKTAADADVYRLYGELLSTYAYELEKGQTEATVSNYYDNYQPVTIKLDPSKDPIQNSQAYYKKYKKYTGSVKYIDEQLKIAQEENNYLEEVLVHIDQADLKDIYDIQNELIDQGYLKKKNKKKRSQNTKSKPREFISSDGDTILVGRNNRQNDELTMKTANRNHWWLHTQNIPGSHVIILNDNPSDKTLSEAAEIAAYYSKYQLASKVPVDIVQVKDLNKPKGGKPGFVTYDRSKTIYATPNLENIKKLAQDGAM